MRPRRPGSVLSSLSGRTGAGPCGGGGRRLRRLRGGAGRLRLAPRPRWGPGAVGEQVAEAHPLQRAAEAVGDEAREAGRGVQHPEALEDQDVELQHLDGLSGSRKHPGAFIVSIN